MSEKRLTQIRERCEAALQSAPCVYYLDEWPGILRNDVPFLLAEVDRLTAECVTARTVYVVLDRDWGETPAMISIHTTQAGGEAAAATYNRVTGDHCDIEERTVDGEEAVPFADAMGSDAELDAKEAGNE